MSDDENENERDATKIFASGASSKFNEKLCGSGNTELELKFRRLKIKLAEVEAEAERIKAEADAARKEADRKQKELERENQELRNKVEALHRKNRDISADYEKLIGTLQSEDSVGSLNKIVSAESNNNKQSSELIGLNRSVANSTVNTSVIPTGCMNASASVSDCTKHIESTTVDESVVLFHMKENPLRAAVRDHERRESLKRKRLDDGETEVDKVSQLEDEITMLKHHVAKLLKQQERLNANNVEHITRYRQSVKLITGYDVKMRSLECIEVSNVYDMSNQFSFQRDGKEISVLDNQYAKKWGNFMEKYLGEYHSLPCFMAAVTLELYNQWTNAAELS